MGPEYGGEGGGLWLRTANQVDRGAAAAVPTLELSGAPRAQDALSHAR